MEDQGFLILRKHQFWDYNNPVYYPGNKNPYKELIQEGKKVIIEKELGGEIKFIGYAEIDSIEEIPPEKRFDPDYSTKVNFKDFVKFFPPRMKNPEIRKNLLLLPSYKWYGSIRPITRDIYNEIIDFCQNPNWPLFFSEMSSFPSQNMSKSINDILTENESEILEFKSSMLHLTRKPNLQNSDFKNSENLSKAESNLKQILEKEIVVTISAFLNTKGGTLIIGIDDNRRILGIENDYKELSKKQDWDGWALHLRNILEKYLDNKLVMQRLNLKSHMINGKTIARIDVPESTKPTYLKQGKEIEFYIRSFNSSEKLSLDYAVDYIHGKENWKKSI